MKIKKIDGEKKVYVMSNGDEVPFKDLKYYLKKGPSVSISAEVTPVKKKRGRKKRSK